MEDNDLVCNFKKCRKRLNTYAWITSCSHIFCDEDGTREFNKSYTCPACESTLSGKFDIIRIDLQPSEQYKSMVLAGQKPEVILEICTRAISFWTYQSCQERIYQEFVATKAREKTVQLEQYYEQVISRTNTELNSLRSQLSSTKKELEGLKKRYNEISEKMSDKSRQYQKLQSLYDALRRKCIHPSSFESGSGSSANTTPGRRQTAFEMPMATLADMMQTRPGSGGGSMDSLRNRQTSPAERDFVIHPVSTPLRTSSSGELRDPRASATDIQNRFSIGLGTPHD